MKGQRFSCNVLSSQPSTENEKTKRTYVMCLTIWINFTNYKRKKSTVEY